VSSHLRTAGLAVLFTGIFVCCGLEAYLSVRTVLRSANPGWLPTYKGDVVRVGVIQPATPADAALRKGDEVLALDGRGVTAPFDVRHVFRSESPGRAYRLLIRRAGELREVSVLTIPYGVSFSSFSHLAFIPVTALFALTGLVVLMLKPRDKHALLLALMFGLFALGVSDRTYGIQGLPLWMGAVLVAGGIVAVFFWPVFLHFFLVFPEPSPLLKRFPRLTKAIYVCPLAAAAFVLVGGVLLIREPELGRGFFRDVGQGSTFAMSMRTLVVGYTTFGLLSLVLNYRQASATSKRKLRVIVAGSLVGFLPLLIIVTATFFVDLFVLGLWTVRGLFIGMILTLPLVPLSFAYAIVRHQVIPVRVMIRRGLRYLLVARGFLLVEALIVVAAVAFLLTGERGAALERWGRHADIGATLLVAATIVSALTLAHRRVMPAIDRRFFREPYDAQRILAEIGAAARSLRTIDDLVGLTVTRIREALHPEDVTVLLWRQESEEYVAVGRPDGRPRVAFGAPVAQRLRISPTAVDVEDPPWSGAPASALLLPIVTKGDLLGIVSLGPRLGDLPYSREDKDLLDAVAWALAFAIENNQLVLRMAEEERLKREIAVAGEVQRRLFPEQPPESVTLELAGVCHPAQGIGGDYYDFLRLGASHIGLAVADVAGKGISAALLMSVVQASLRSQARAEGVALTDLVASMNELLYRSTARNSFASFFYAQFDESTRRLTYVNAGHNPPMLVRPRGFDEEPMEGLDGGFGHRSSSFAGRSGSALLSAPVASARTAVRLLQTGGLVIGAIQKPTYEQETVQLEAGDVLVAYTDGVTEAFSADGEEFGEERLRAVVAASNGQAPAELAETIVREVRDWSRNTPQHDDITLVVARVG
jgi:sigma-B regulation protein RsbU (phosphoserine phosphatase)